MVKRAIYLDYAASAPARPQVAKLAARLVEESWGNPASVHSFGRAAALVLDNARRDVAEVLNCDAAEVVFTSGGTEADNLALLGFAESMPKGHLITTSIEHKAVLECCKRLERRGWQVSYISPGKDGVVKVEDIAAAINDQTRLVSVMYANNEIGTIQPIRELGKMIEAVNHGRKNRIWFHSDAVQAATLLDLNTKYLHVDMLTISGHKLGGMKGSGCLYANKALPAFAWLLGGGQESGRRSGTPNVAGAAALAEAMRIANKTREQEHARLLELQRWLIAELKTMPGVVLNGSTNRRLPSNINVSIKSRSSDELVIALDLRGIAVSAASACASGSIQESYVISALGRNGWRARHSLRISTGYATKKSELVTLVKELKKIV